jgi:hypothetical protein
MMFNLIFPTKSTPALTKTVPEIFIQRLYSSEQRWEGINAQVYQLYPPKEPQQLQIDCDMIILHLHGTVDLQRQVGARREQGLSYRGGICLDPRGESSHRRELRGA